MSRATVVRKGSQLRQRIVGKDSATDLAIPGYGAIRDEFQFGHVWHREGLPLQDRMIAVLACLTLLRHGNLLASKAAAALDMGIEPRALSELVLQVGIYGGLPIVEEAAAVLGEAFQERQAFPTGELLPAEDWETLQAAANAYQVSLHGERRHQGHADPADGYTAELYAIATYYGYGLIWRRPGLSLRRRLIVALASFAVLGGVDGFFSKFAASAAEHGIGGREITEVVIQTAPYIGFPRALQALRLMRGVFGDAGASKEPKASEEGCK